MTRRKKPSALDAGPTVMALGRGGDSLTPAPNFDSAAALIHDVERRFLSAYWHDPVGGFNAAVDSGLTAASFWCEEHRAVCCTLAARAEALVDQGSLWTITDIRCVVEGLGVQLVAGDDGDELRRTLECESSGAGVRGYAACVAYYSRVRAQTRMLYRVLRDVPANLRDFGTNRASNHHKRGSAA